MLWWAKKDLAVLTLHVALLEPAEQHMDDKDTTLSMITWPDGLLNGLHMNANHVGKLLVYFSLWLLSDFVPLYCTPYDKQVAEWADLKSQKHTCQSRPPQQHHRQRQSLWPATIAKTTPFCVTGPPTSLTVSSWLCQPVYPSWAKNCRWHSTYAGWSVFSHMHMLHAYYAHGLHVIYTKI